MPAAPISIDALLPENSEEMLVLKLLLRLAARAVEADESSLLLLDEGREELVFGMTVASDPAAGDASHKALRGQAVPLGKGITGLAAAAREVQIGAPTFGIAQSEKRKQGPKGVLAAPMLLGDDVVGVITAVRFVEERGFKNEHAMHYASISTIAAHIVSKRARGEAAATSSLGASHDLGRRAAAAISRVASARVGDLERVMALVSGIEAIADLVERGR